MATAMSMPEAVPYLRLLAQAAGSATALLSRVLALARQSMRDDAQSVRGLLERDQLELSIKLLDTHAARMGERFPLILSEAFRHHGDSAAKQDVLAGRVLRFDQLELMDEWQVQERVETVRALQHVVLKVEASLAELNTYVCALMGLRYVSPERNPLRPDVYVGALQQLMTELRLPTLVCSAWLHHMASGLGETLEAAYLEWSAQLQGLRVQRVGYTVVRTPESAMRSDQRHQRGNDSAVSVPQYRQMVLTLDRLRRLMVDKLETGPESQQEVFARQFAREFEADEAAGIGLVSNTGFAATLPAALDALQEMQQLDVVVQRMQQRPPPTVGADGGRAGGLVRETLKQGESAMNQLLSVEVVSLMVDNLIRDERLLPPVRKIIERLEPALLQLVVIDPQFFIDRQHPARCLLQEISQRGLGFATVDEPDFNAFMLSLQRFVSPLAELKIDSAQPFEEALSRLLRDRDPADSRATIASQIDNAAAVLGYAEERNLLAGQMGLRLKAIPDMTKVPLAMVEFLLGPWSQVMAEGQLKDASGAEDAGGYKALVNDMLWSAQPVLTRKDVTRLSRLVPRLLAKLREGLGLIDYPPVKTSAFFDVLMNLHQLAFRPAVPEVVPVAAARLAPRLLEPEDHWVAPAEAIASGFMAFTEDSLPKTPSPLVDVAEPALVEPALPAVADLPAPPLLAAALAVGAWLELEIKGIWQRTQLSWISPHGTMYLFTSGQGKTQSMTQRMIERLLTSGKLRVVSDQPSMVDGALDAVVHTALLNSIDLAS